MSDTTGSADLVSGAATSSVPPGRRGLLRSIVHRLAGEQVALPVEGRLQSFEGATGWLNSDPLTPEGLRGRVVLVDFWTYTCVNWLRTLPYLRAWAAKYRNDGLTVIGVHTPEFDFEANIDNVIAQSRRLGVEYPIAVDSGYGVWRAFANHFWPALYIADAAGRIRFHHFGEGEYPMTEMVIQQLLVDGGADGVDQDLVMVEPHGLEVARVGGDRCQHRSTRSGTWASHADRVAQGRQAGDDATRPTCRPGRRPGRRRTAGRSDLPRRQR